jgi:CRISPR-associated protein Csb2
MESKSGARRWHCHAVVTFPVEVEGPVLAGAGRFKGYGLFRPLREEA